VLVVAHTLGHKHSQLTTLPLAKLSTACCLRGGDTEPLRFKAVKFFLL